MTRIAIVEDKPEISTGICYVLSYNKDFTCDVFNSAETALNRVSSRDFDIVLMDIQLPKMSGIECTRILKQQYPDLKIMMFTVFEEDEKILGAISAGADGYFLKRSDPDLLVRAINELMAGGAHISSDVAGKVLKAFREALPNDMSRSPLSEREKEILSLISSGLRNNEVADKLFISISTVKSHIYSIYQKLHVSSKIEAINKFRNSTK